MYPSHVIQLMKNIGFNKFGCTLCAELHGWKFVRLRNLAWEFLGVNVYFVSNVHSPK